MPGASAPTAAARVLLIDGARTSQLPYVTHGASDRGHDDGLVHRVQDLIDDELAGALRLHDLGRQVGLSTRSLARHFRHAVGSAPRSYIRDRRMDVAHRLLETTSTPIDSIRRQVGYGDPSAFRRVFKRHTGITPTQYRERYGWPGARRAGPAR